MRLALFDLDGTLTTRDTLMPFLRQVVRTPAFVAGIVRLMPRLLGYAAGVLPNHMVKEAALIHFLGGRRIADLRTAGEAFARLRIPQLVRSDALDRLYKHQARGDTCVLVTASLDVYVEPWGRALGFDAILCSSLEIVGETATGRLRDGNCYGIEKVRRIQAWLNGRRTDQVWAYGNSRGDREMLETADVAIYRGRCVKGH